MNGTPGKVSFTLRAKVWLYQGIGGWHFVTLSVKRSNMIRALYGMEAKPFGSLPVTVTIGQTEWKTSLFPDKRSNAYLFAIKSAVRKKERITHGMLITAKVHML